MEQTFWEETILKQITFSIQNHFEIIQGYNNKKLTMLRGNLSRVTKSERESEI